jgi:hypothetical protein
LIGRLRQLSGFHAFALIGIVSKLCYKEHLF